MKYKVYGDYGYRSECELYESDNLQEAKVWAGNYVRWGDFGGYSVIEVFHFEGKARVVDYCLENEGVEDDYCLCDDGA